MVMIRNQDTGMCIRGPNRQSIISSGSEHARTIGEQSDCAAIPDVALNPTVEKKKKNSKPARHSVV